MRETAMANMDLRTMSKFKLQLQMLVTEVRQLRVSPRLHIFEDGSNSYNSFLREIPRKEIIWLLNRPIICCRFNYNNSSVVVISSSSFYARLEVQNKKQAHDEYLRKLHDLQTELVSSNELQEKLERQVSYLENENAVLCNRQNELQGTIHSLLQAREKFIDVYKESTSEMKHSLEIKEKRVVFLSKKLSTHLELFESIQKEAVAVKRVVKDVQCILREKEQVATQLKKKMNESLVFERMFTEKISELEKKVGEDRKELLQKETVILALQGQLEALRINRNNSTQLDNFQKAMSEKDKCIQNLTLEKKALLCELWRLGTILHKIEGTIATMNEEDNKKFSAILDGQEENSMNDKGIKVRRKIQPAKFLQTIQLYLKIRVTKQ